MKYLCLFLLFAVSLVGISGVYAESITADLEDNLLRLHVIANSNSRRDQEIKLKVRDAIRDDLNYLNYNKDKKELSII